MATIKIKSHSVEATESLSLALLRVGLKVWRERQALPYGIVLNGMSEPEFVCFEIDDDCVDMDEDDDEDMGDTCGEGDGAADSEDGEETTLVEETTIKAYEEEEPANWYFTFGYGQKFQRGYIVINGTHTGARAQMVEWFGREWASQYSSADEAGVDRFNLREVVVRHGKPYWEEESDIAD